MSREFYAAMESYHQDLAKEFAAQPKSSQHVEVRIDDMIYVYLHRDGAHIQTQTIDIPDAWQANWPSDATVRRYIHRYATIGSARIMTLDA